jgi:photosystem II stability/assembly factor-like uncharacterized protein
MSKMFPGIILIIVAGLIVYLAPWFSGFFTSGSLANLSINDSVFYVSNDAGNEFQPQSDGLMVSEIIDVVFLDSQSSYLCTSQGVFKLNNLKNKWERIKDQTGVLEFPSRISSLVFDDNQTAFIAVNKNNRGKIYFTSDNFQTLKEIYVTSQEGAEINDLKISQSGRIYFLSTEKILGYSDDNGQTFKLMTHLDRDFKKIVISQKNNNVIYLWGDEYIYKSVDAGYNFYNLGFTLSNINDFFINNKEIIYIATNNGAFHSFDGGWNWRLMDSLLPKDLPAGAISYNNERGEVIISFGGRLYISQDSLAWSIKSISTNNINIIKINPFNLNQVLVGIKK